MHYLDNYFLVGWPTHPSVPSMSRPFSTWPLRWAYPLPPNKLEGPATRLVFLGILIDTNCMKTSLRDNKLHELISELQSSSTRNKCLKRELLSFIGKLNYWIIPAGCIFLRSLIVLSTSACLPLLLVKCSKLIRAYQTFILLLFRSIINIIFNYLFSAYTRKPS